jgi:hypothetical protein
MRAASAAPARATRHGRGQAVHPSELSAPRRGRARLDAALHRLQTNMSVLREGGGGGRGSPRTVEKVMARAARARDAAAAVDQAADAAAAAATAEEGEGGADATRRCLARELA